MESSVNLEAVLLRPLPYRDLQSLCVLWRIRSGQVCHLGLELLPGHPRLE